MFYITHSFGSPVFKDYKYSVISETYITSFSRFFLLSTNNVRMSEGTFCRVEVQMVLCCKFYLVIVHIHNMIKW